MALADEDGAALVERHELSQRAATVRQDCHAVAI